MVPNGISGWLIIPAIGLVFAPLKTIVMEILGIRMIMLFMPNILNDKRLWIVGVLDIIMIGAFFIVAIWFFQKRKRTVKAIVLLMIASIIANLGQFFLNGQIFDDYTLDIFMPVLHASVFASIWIPYFLKSTRVNNTFTR